MIKYKRYFAAAICAMTLLIPVSALAEGMTVQPVTAETATVQQEPAPPGDQPAPADETVTDAQPVDADTTAETNVPPVQAGPRVVLNWNELSLSDAPVIQNGTMYVSVRAFCEALGCSVSWIAQDNAVYVTRSDLSVYLDIGSRSIWANKRNWYMSEPCTMINGAAMVPIRELAKLFSCSVDWYTDTQTAYLLGGGALKTADEFYDKEDLLWLARIIYLEAGNQPMDGMVAVGNVILNRVESSMFPDNVHDVIFDRRNGTQFTPSGSDKIYCNPPERCFTAAKLALEGYDVVPDCLYFVSLRSSESCWAARHRPYYGVIGGHVFYK